MRNAWKIIFLPCSVLFKFDVERYKIKYQRNRTRIILEGVPSFCKTTLPSPGESETEASQRDQHLRRRELLLLRKYQAILSETWKKPGIEYSDFESPPTPGRSRSFRSAAYIKEWNEVFTREISRSFSTVSFASVHSCSFSRIS